MDKKKKPTITRDLIEKATSQEAKEALMKIDIEYQEKQSQLDNQQLEQDGNFFMGRMAGIHSEKDSQDYSNIRKQMQVNLYDHHRSEAEKTYEQFHPNEEIEPEEVFADSKDDVADYIKGYNEAYILFHENRELTQSLDRSFDGKNSPQIEGFLQCSKELTEKEITAELDGLENRSMDKDLDKGRFRDFTKSAEQSRMDKPSHDKDRN